MNWLDSLSRYDQSQIEILLRSRPLTQAEQIELSVHINTPGAISRAVRDGYILVAQLLIDRGAAPIYVNLIDAIQSGNLATTRLVLRYVSPGLISAWLPQLLLTSSSQMVELVCNDSRTDPNVMQFISFLKMLRDGNHTAVQSLSWLIEGRVSAAQKAASATLSKESVISLDSVIEQAYNEYFRSLLTGESITNELASLALDSLAS